MAMAMAAECRWGIKAIGMGSWRRGGGRGQKRITRGNRLRGGEQGDLGWLRKELQEAVEREDYARAAELRDKADRAKLEAELAVEAANAAFYRAFSARSEGAMARVWAEGDHVRCIHPQAGEIRGREGVLESWRDVFEGARGMEVRPEGVSIVVSGGMAVVTCVEVAEAPESAGRLVATNAFELSHSGEWRMFLHHASPIG